MLNFVYSAGVGAYLTLSMAKITNHKSGLDAEELACQFLRNSGFEILQQRYKTPHGEIDIVARNKTTLIFVEVKKRKSFGFDDPISNKQKKRITNAALQYISENSQISELEMRFDCILIDSGNLVTHINNAWMYEETS